MKNKTHGIRSREGAALLVVVLMMGTCMIAVSSVVYCVGAQMRRSWRQVQTEQAFFLAEAGVEHAAAYVISAAGGIVSSTTLAGELGGGRYETQVIASDLGGSGQTIDVLSTGFVGGMSRRIKVEGLRNMTWARFALWYDQEALSLVIAAGDRFEGQVYSKPLMRFTNRNLASQGQAHFLERVWTVPSYIQCDSGADPIFDRGLITSADEQTMTSVDLPTLKTVAQTVSGGLLLKGNTTIELRGPRMYIKNAERGWDNHSLPIPADAIVYVEPHTYTETYIDRRGKLKTRTVTEPGNIDVSAPRGFNGEVTLVSDNNINIVDHVRYGQDPLESSASTDVLGLIAKNNVVVETSAPDNLDIYAHILCRDGGFGVKDYNKGSFRGTLKVVGGIANLIRNAVGTTAPTGYLKNYIFDNRLTRYPPPYYPRLPDRLEWDSWEG
ncbi:MAG: hypothetical protein ACOX9C_07525 [Kiritimatiellia bacterium]|jgi:hypothetical protein